MMAPCCSVSLLALSNMCQFKFHNLCKYCIFHGECLEATFMSSSGTTKFHRNMRSRNVKRCCLRNFIICDVIYLFKLLQWKGVASETLLYVMLFIYSSYCNEKVLPQKLYYMWCYLSIQVIAIIEVIFKTHVKFIK